MMILPFSCSLIAVGVNRTPGAPALRHAESDALKISLPFLSQLGPVAAENSTLLRGRDATYAEFDAALVREERRRPDYLVVSFAGHGNSDGVGMADRLYPFSRLQQRVERIGAHGTLLLLDSCGSGGFAKSAVIGGVGSIDEAWGALLLAALPGTRVFMASSSMGSAFEREGVGGLYTDAIVRAMWRRQRGDLEYQGLSFVSDALVARRASVQMRRLGLRPKRAGVFGDLPLAIANHHRVGSAEVATLRETEGGGLKIQVNLHNRLLLPTKIVATATDSFGHRWPSTKIMALPQDTDEAIAARFAVDVTDSRHVRRQLSRHGLCSVRWKIEVLDAEERCLARRRYLAIYTA